MKLNILKNLTTLTMCSFTVLFLLIGCKQEEEHGLKITYFDIDKNELFLDIAGATDVVNIKTNLNGIAIEVSEPWCKAKLISDKGLEVKVDAVPDGIDERKAEIVLKSEYDSKKVITVSQIALNDSKIKVAKANAEYAHSANSIGLSIDNDYNTYFMSHWSETQFPFDVIYDFEGVNKIDFLRYHPRPGGENKNGLLAKFEIWYTTKSNSTFVRYGEYDFQYAAEIKEIAFTPALIEPKQIKLVLYQGYGTGTYAAIGEMEFFKAGMK